MRHAGDIRRREDQVPGNLALDPLREDGARQVDLGEIVEAEDAVVIRFGSGRERMQPASAGVAENSIQGREATEGFVHYPVQRRGIRDVGGEVNI